MNLDIALLDLLPVDASVKGLCVLLTCRGTCSFTCGITEMQK